jgi:hypothetical protein
MMGLLKKMIQKKGSEKSNEENEEFLETYGKAIDFTNINNIKEIVDYCK